jgi:hypothetical protein
VGTILGDFSGSREPVSIFYIEINGDFIFDFRIFTLWTVFIERITIVNRGMDVFDFECVSVFGSNLVLIRFVLILTD